MHTQSSLPAWRDDRVAISTAFLAFLGVVGIPVSLFACLVWFAIKR